VGRRDVAVAAAALYAVEPLSVTYAPLLLSETLFSALLVWGIYFLVVYYRETRSRELLGGIALLALAAYVRPAGYYLPFCVVALVALQHAVAGEWKRLSRVGAALLLTFAIIVPWEARNRAHGFEGFSAISSVNLHFYIAASVLAQQESRSLEEQQRQMGYLDEERYLALHPEQRGWSRGDRYGYMAAEGVRVVRENPAEYGLIHLRGMGRILLDPAFQEVFRISGIYPEEGGGLTARIRIDGAPDAISAFLRDHMAAAVVIFSLSLFLLASYLLAAAGVGVERRWRDPAVVLLLCTIAYIVVIGGGPVGYARFRHPVMPLLCVLAGIGLVGAWKRWRDWRGHQGAPLTSSAPPLTESR
jgi:4-amino-4-deoxy-L-arabinose transferase-like glycosyltransferase